MSQSFYSLIKAHSPSGNVLLLSQYLSNVIMHKMRLAMAYVFEISNEYAGRVLDKLHELAYNN